MNGGQELITQETTAPGLVYEDAQLQSRPSASVTVPGPAWAFRFDTPAGRIVISGDHGALRGHRGSRARLRHPGARGLPGAGLRRPDAGLAALSRQRPHFYARAGGAGRACAAGLLVLVHQLCWGGSVESLADEVQESYDGAVVNGRDLLRIPLPH